MEIEAIRGVLARYRPPYRFRLADGDVVTVDDPKGLVLPPEGFAGQTIVYYYPHKKGLTLFDAFMVTAVEVGGHVVANGAPSRKPRRSPKRR